MHIVSPLEMHFSMLYSILTEHISEDVDYKVSAITASRLHICLASFRVLSLQAYS